LHPNDGEAAEIELENVPSLSWRAPWMKKYKTKSHLLFGTDSSARTRILEALMDQLINHNFWKQQLPKDVNLRQLLNEACNNCLLSEIELVHFKHNFDHLMELLPTMWNRPKMPKDDAKLLIYCLCVWTLEHDFAASE
jgi:hypothetical protein